MRLNMCSKNVTNINFVAIRCVLSSSKCTKTRFRDSAGAADDAPPDPLVGWEGDTISPCPSPSMPMHWT